MKQLVFEMNLVTLFITERALARNLPKDLTDLLVTFLHPEIYVPWEPPEWAPVPEHVEMNYGHLPMCPTESPAFV